VKNSARIYSVIILLASCFIALFLAVPQSFALSVVESSPQPYGATIHVGGCTARENTFDNIYLYSPSSAGEINYDTEYCGNEIGSDPVSFGYYNYSNAGQNIYGPGTYTFVELTNNTCDATTLTTARACSEYAGEASFTFSVPTCTVTVSPARVDVSSTNDVNFHITNGGQAPFEWIKITRPSGNFTIEGVGGDGSEFITGVEVSAGTAYDQLLSVTSGADIAGSANWSVSVADNPNGENPVTCIGDLGTAITVHVNPLTISNVTVTNTSATSETVTWDTNIEADSYIYYGQTSDYGLIGSDTNLGKSHSITLTDLSEDTTYKFYLQVTDGAGNTTRSTEATFTTSSAAPTTVTVTVTNTVTTTVTNTITPTPIPTPVPDRAPPVAYLSNDFGKPFQKAPLISGKASDNTAVSSISYSIDDGKNWLPVDLISAAGAKTTGFSFTPVIFEDGNYKIKIMAKDPAGNVGTSGVYTLIYDRLPPQIGGVMYSVGPQPLTPDENGLILTFPDMNQKITLSTVGGPTKLDIIISIIQSSSASAIVSDVSLTKNIDNGLWGGILRFSRPGVYRLSVKAADGAGNKTERKLNTVVVLEGGKVLSGNSPVTSGSVALWYFDNQTQRFVVWDGAAYGQSNPQSISKNGSYGFFVPAGKYYLEVKSNGFKTLRSEIFSLQESTPITSKLYLEKSLGLHLGPFVIPLPDFSVSRQTIVLEAPSVPGEAKSVTGVVGNEFPNVDLFRDGNTVPTLSFQGKPTVYIFVSTWSPYVSQSLEFVKNLAGNPQINVVPVVSQETSTSTSIFTKKGGYSFPIYSDPDGLLVNPVGLSFLPTNVFVDRKGIIQKVKTGILTENEILGNMIY
jgi:hypothetical protein